MIDVHCASHSLSLSLSVCVCVCMCVCVHAVLKAFKKKFNCNGTIVDDPEHGMVIQLQGDQRQNVLQFLTEEGIAKKDIIKIHGR